MQDAYSLPSELSIYTVADLRTQWLAWLGDATDEPCRLDGAAVDEVDAAGLQLLLALSNALARQQRSLQVLDASRPLADACAALGVSHLLASAGLDEVAR